jgi:hypothetical protein
MTLAGLTSYRKIFEWTNGSECATRIVADAPILMSPREFASDLKNERLRPLPLRRRDKPR